MADSSVNDARAAQDLAIELARWYHQLAKLCVTAAERTVQLTEDCSQAELDEALALADQVRVRMASVQSAERVFRKEFPRLYIDHQVRRILSLEPGPGKAAGAAAAKLK
jgi:hypothetical protein